MGVLAYSLIDDLVLGCFHTSYVIFVCCLTTMAKDSRYTGSLYEANIGS